MGYQDHHVPFTQVRGLGGLTLTLRFFWDQCFSNLAWFSGSFSGTPWSLKNPAGGPPRFVSISPRASWSGFLEQFDWGGPHLRKKSLSGTWSTHPNASPHPRHALPLTPFFGAFPGFRAGGYICHCVDFACTLQLHLSRPASPPWGGGCQLALDHAPTSLFESHLVPLLTRAHPLAHLSGVLPQTN